MRVLGVLALTGLMVTLVGCSSNGNSGAATGPTPMPAPNGPTAAVTIPSDASVLGSAAFGNPLAVAAGTTVTWTNNDSIPHTSTSNSGAWNSGTIEPGSSFSAVLSTKGTFPYHCTIHPGMMGTITVQ